MKRNIFTPLIYTSLFIYFLVFASGCSSDSEERSFADQSPPKWETINQDEVEYLKAKDNNIKSRKTISYFYNAQREAAGKGYLVEELFYDENGLKIEQIRYFSNGDVDMIWKFKYDDYGYLLESTTHDGYDRLFYSRNSEYEGDIERSREEFDIQLKEPKFLEFEYNERSQLSEVKIYDADKEIESREEYIYSNGYLVKKSVFGKNANLIKETTFKYDGSWNKIEEVNFAPPNFRDTISYSYDGSNNLTLIDAGYYKQEFSYDAQGNVLVEKFYSKEGYLQQLITYTYDYRGLLVEKVKHDGEEVPVLLITYEYEFY